MTAHRPSAGDPPSTSASGGDRPRLYLSPPEVGDDERRMLLEAFDSNWIAPLGPDVDAFEAELARRIGTPHAVALSSGTAALHLALLLLGVGPDDEVLLPTLTFVASAAAVTYLGALPVFVDCDAADWQIDPALLAEALAERCRRGRRPAAVVSVDLYGQCADYDRITEACAAYDVPLVEDAAEALGATYRGAAAGSFGAAGVFSFNGNKIVTTSGGGMLVTASEAMAERARHLATQAREPVPHYEHTSLGYNYRLSNLLASLGRAQLRSLDDRIAGRRAVNQRYRARLAECPGIDFMPWSPAGEPNYWLTCILIDPDRFGADREAVRLALEARNIESRPTWKPMHLQPVFADAEVVGGRVAAHIFERGLCLPSGSRLADDEVDTVAELVAACAR